MTETYRVKIDGLKEGTVKDQAVYQLVILFKRSQSDVLRIIDNKGTVVKKGLELQTAIKYKFAVEQCGCCCVIEPEQEAKPAVEPDFTAFSEPSAAVADAPPKFTLVEKDPEPTVPEKAAPPVVPIKAAEKKEKREKPGATVSNEVGTTINGDPFIVYTPHTFCCNCGGQGEIESIETHFFKDLVFSTSFEKDKAIALALPYCPACSENIGKYPLSGVWKWLVGFAIWCALLVLIFSQVNVPLLPTFVKVLVLLVPLIPAVYAVRWLGRPKPPKTSNYTPVRIKEFARNPNAARYEGAALRIVSIFAALLGLIVRRFSKYDPDAIKKMTFIFSNPAYAKDFRKKNKHFIQDGFIKVR